MTKIIAPKFWGEDNVKKLLKTYDHLTIAFLDTHDIKIEKEMRKRIREMGIKLKLVASSTAPRVDRDEYVVRGEISQRKERELLKSISDLKVPNTVSFREFKKTPFFPVVVKNPREHAGTGKFLLENDEQWKKLKAFMEVGPDLESEKGFNLNPSNEGLFAFQQYIETPSDRYTSYRVLVSANGTIIAAGLFYSDTCKSDSKILIENVPLPKNAIYWWDKSLSAWLFAEASPFFLGAKECRSNIYRGGKAIVLNPNENSKQISEGEEEILEAHKLDSKHPELPDELVELSKKIGSTLGRRLGLYVGIDFIQSVDGNFYYLETNGGPGRQLYLDTYNKGHGCEYTAYRMMLEKVLLELA